METPANVHHFLPHRMVALSSSTPFSAAPAQPSICDLRAESWQQPSSQPSSSTSFLSSKWEASRKSRKNVFSLTSLEILWRKLESRQHQYYRNSHKILSQPTDMKPSLLGAGLRDFSVKEAISRKESQVFTSMKLADTGSGVMGSDCSWGRDSILTEIWRVFLKVPVFKVWPLGDSCLKGK